MFKQVGVRATECWEEDADEEFAINLESPGYKDIKNDDPGCQIQNCQLTFGLGGFSFNSNGRPYICNGFLTI